MASDQFDPEKEQAILATFKDPDKAQQAKKALQNVGIETVQIDRVSRYVGEPTQQVVNPITGEPESMAEQTLGTEFSRKSTRILAAADPSVYSMGGGELVSGEDILLTVVCPKVKTEHAVKTIRSFGGNT